MLTLVEQAVNTATQYHHGQTYGDLTYMDGHLHLVALQAEVIADGLKLSPTEVECVVSIAYLHDILEDTQCDMETLKMSLNRCPDAIFNGVNALTKEGSQRVAYLAQVVQGGLFAIIVKIADSMCNLRASLASGNCKNILKYADNINYLTTMLVRAVERRNAF